jgi:drug/metabolite transporter (DMT)-like permease
MKPMVDALHRPSDGFKETSFRQQYLLTQTSSFASPRQPFRYAPPKTPTGPHLPLATLTPTSTQNTLKGVALVSLAVLLFAAADTVGKHLTTLYAIPFILAVRYAVNLGLLAAILGPIHGPALWRTNRTGLVYLRGLSLVAGSISMLLALRVMPVGETVAIVYLSPFLVMLIAGRFMGESVTPLGWLAALCGFAGVLLIVRPGSGLDPFGVAISLFNVACATAYHLLSRSLSRTETMPAMVFHTALVGTVIFGLATLFTFDARIPDTQGWLLLLALGAITTAAHFLFTSAYREAPASLLAPINYLHLVWAAILGWLVFAHVPDALALTGMAAIVLSGALLTLAARRA